MNICDSCYAKDKTVKQSYHTVKFAILVGGTQQGKESDETHVCFECYKEMSDACDLLKYTLARRGATTLMEGIRKTLHTE